jgi:hypothetical protein
MPTIKDYQKTKKARRRPGRDESVETEVEAAPEVPEEVIAEEIAATPSEEDTFGNHHPEADRKKIHIEFPYSELVRAKVPKAFEVAENVAEEWVNDGRFENIPVGHPLAQLTVAAGLRKAKEVEKKLEEKGVFMMAKMGLEYAKSKVNSKLNKK